MRNQLCTSKEWLGEDRCDKGCLIELGSLLSFNQMCIFASWEAYLVFWNDQALSHYSILEFILIGWPLTFSKTEKVLALTILGSSKVRRNAISNEVFVDVWHFLLVILLAINIFCNMRLLHCKYLFRNQAWSKLDEHIFKYKHNCFILSSSGKIWRYLARLKSPSFDSLHQFMALDLFILWLCLQEALNLELGLSNWIYNLKKSAFITNSTKFWLEIMRYLDILHV
jgi:hypothetical protein